MLPAHEAIGIRDLRQRASVVLREVESGVTFGPDRGRPVAVLSPMAARARSTGCVLRATSPADRGSRRPPSRRCRSPPGRRRLDRTRACGPMSVKRTTYLTRRHREARRTARIGYPVAIFGAPSII
jgi:antitoxin (DNA-binding transcriptional repressor) of toxin-antitoxin stability system